MREVALLAPASHGDRHIRYVESLKMDVDLVFIEKKGLPAPETQGDTARIIPELIDLAIKSEKKGYKALVQWCHGDPAVKATREFVKVPVLGPGEIGIHTAAILGQKFSILVPSLNIKRWEYQNVETYGLINRLASIRVFNFTVEELFEEWEEHVKGREDLKTIQATVNECIRAVEEDDASVVMFGCGGMTWMHNAVSKRLLEKDVRIPLVNPLPLAVQFAKSLVKLKLSHISTE